MPQIVWTSDPEGAVNYFNRRLKEYAGIDAAEVEGRSWRELVHPDDLPRSSDRWTRSVRTGEPYEVEYRLRRGDGTYGWQLVRGPADAR